MTEKGGIEGVFLRPLPMRAAPGVPGESFGKLDEGRIYYYTHSHSASRERSSYGCEVLQTPRHQKSVFKGKV